jgi:flagellar basal-body rod modification protein FlgD
MDIAVSPTNGHEFFGAAPTKPKSELDMETFLQLLTTQLANQNPLEPMNDRDFFAQMAQLGQVQGLDKLDKSMAVTQANDMIGKTVTALRPQSETSGTNDTLVQGVVKSMIVRNGERYLQVQEANGGIAEVLPENVQSISDTPQSTSLQKIIDAANAANLIGKNMTAPHPTLKNADGTPETLDAKVQRVSFDKDGIFLTVTDRLGSTVKVPLVTVTSFSQPTTP